MKNLFMFLILFPILTGCSLWKKGEGAAQRDQQQQQQGFPLVVWEVPMISKPGGESLISLRYSQETRDKCGAAAQPVNCLPEVYDELAIRDSKGAVHAFPFKEALDHMIESMKHLKKK